MVAEEVRKLAEGSAEAVRKIDKLIKSIQSETQDAVKSIQASSQEVQEGRIEVAKIADVLGEINSYAGNIGSFFCRLFNSIPVSFVAINSKINVNARPVRAQ